MINRLTVRLQKYKFELITVFLAIISLSIYLPLSLQNTDYFSSPDENSIYYFAKEYSKMPQLSYQYNYDSKLSYNSIKPRATFVSDGKVVPVLSNGMIITSGALAALLTEKFVLLYTPIVFITSIFYYKKLILRLFGQFVSTLATIEYVTLSPFLYLGTKPMVLDIATLSFFIIGIYYYLFHEFKFSKIILSGFFLSYSIFFNHKFIFIVFAFMLPNLFDFSNELIKHSSEFKTVFLKYIRLLDLFIIGSIPSIGVIAITNKILYGNFFRDGYVASSANNLSSGGVKSPLFYISFIKILLNSKSYYLEIFSPLFFVLVIVGLFYFLFVQMRKNRMQQIHYFLIFISASIAITFTYFASIASWGYDINTISASFVRYLLPTYAFTIPFFFVFLTKYYKQTLSLVVIIFINVYSLIYYINSGYIATLSYVDGVKSVRESILESTKPSDIIVTAYYDKIIFPYRQTVDVSSLPVTYVGETPKLRSDVIVNVIKYIAQTKGYTYVINDFDLNTYQQVKNSLSADHLHLKENDLTQHNVLLKVSYE